MTEFPSLLVLLGSLVFLASTSSQPGTEIMSCYVFHLVYVPRKAYGFFMVGSSDSGKDISYRRLWRPLIGHDGKVYACSEKDLLAFESNGTIAWTLHLNYSCRFDMPPIHGGKEKVCDFQSLNSHIVNCIKFGIWLLVL